MEKDKVDKTVIAILELDQTKTDCINNDKEDKDRRIKGPVHKEITIMLNLDMSHNID